MKNKIIMLFISIFTSLFLFSSNVLANTYDFVYPTSITSLDEDDFSAMLSTISSLNINKHYVIVIQYNSDTNVYTYSVYFSEKDVFKLLSGSYIQLGYCDIYHFSDDTFSSLTYYNSRVINPNVVFSTISSYIIYSDIPISFSNNTNIYNYTYIDKVYTMPTSDDTFLPIYDLYNNYHNPTPLITDFTTLVIDRLNYITSYFSSNYIYLSIFVIFLLYFSILLVRRFI